MFDLTIDAFCHEVVMHLKGILNASGSVYDDVLITTNAKSNNVDKHYLCIRYNNCGPSFNMTDYYESLLPQLNGHPEVDNIQEEHLQTYFNDLAHKLANDYLAASINMAKANCDIENLVKVLADKTYVLDNIYFELVDADRNPPISLDDESALFNMPMFDLPHFTCQFLVKLPADDDSIMTCKLTNSLFKIIGVPGNELLKAAIKNTQAFDPTGEHIHLHTPIDTLLLMSMPGLPDWQLDIIKQDIMANSPLGIIMDDDADNKMLVLKHDFLKPMSLLYSPLIMEKAAKKLGAKSEIIVIPSSKEELIIMSNDNNIADAMDIKNMVPQVNKENVSEDEVLSDIPIKYNILTGELYEVI